MRVVEEWEGDERMKGWQTGGTGEGWRMGWVMRVGIRL